jgi:hypothetical protein
MPIPLYKDQTAEQRKIYGAIFEQRMLRLIAKSIRKNTETRLLEGGCVLLVNRRFMIRHPLEP